MSRLLKEPNVRGDGWSKTWLTERQDLTCYSLSKVVKKTQHNYYCRPLWNCLRKTPVVRREMRALIALRKLGLPVPLVIGYMSDPVESSLLTTFIEGGYSLRESLVVPGSQRLLIAGAVARVIGALHRSLWTHGALYPEHLLVTDPAGKPQVHLIDLEKAKYLGNRRKDLDRFLRYENGLWHEERIVFEKVYKEELSGKSSLQAPATRASMI